MSLDDENDGETLARLDSVPPEGDVHEAGTIVREAPKDLVEQLRQQKKIKPPVPSSSQDKMRAVSSGNAGLPSTQSEPPPGMPEENTARRAVSEALAAQTASSLPKMGVPGALPPTPPPPADLGGSIPPVPGLMSGKDVTKISYGLLGGGAVAFLLTLLVSKWFFLLAVALIAGGLWLGGFLSKLNQKPH